MQVISHREPEVSVRVLPGKLDDVLARTQELDHREGEVGKPYGIRLAALVKELFEGACARL